MTRKEKNSENDCITVQKKIWSISRWRRKTWNMFSIVIKIDSLTHAFSFYFRKRQQKYIIIDEAHQPSKLTKQIKKQREYRTFALPYWRFDTHFISHPLRGVFLVLCFFIIFWCFDGFLSLPLQLEKRFLIRSCLVFSFLAHTRVFYSVLIF